MILIEQDRCRLLARCTHAYYRGLPLSESRAKVRPRTYQHFVKLSRSRFTYTIKVRGRQCLNAVVRGNRLSGSGIWVGWMWGWGHSLTGNNKHVYARDGNEMGSPQIVAVIYRRAYLHYHFELIPLPNFLGHDVHIQRFGVWRGQ